MYENNMSNILQTDLIESLELPETLKVRVNKVSSSSRRQQLPPSFVLYLPTVVLRKKHNPAFALACRLANHYQVPLILLVVVLDDAHLPSNSNSRRPIVMTSRRLAFIMEALSSATQEWEQHGAGVAIRVHGPQARTPHHLTLARNAVAVVTDEPFVFPFLKFVQSVEQATKSAGIPCFRVDGSTTVPPLCKLERQSYAGVSANAWMWQKKTDGNRISHVYGATKEGHFDAPELVTKLEPSFFLSLSRGDELYKCIPAEWKDEGNDAPGRRPFTVKELISVQDFKQWALQWPGADSSVPPCQQTHGSSSAGQERWNNFRSNHLASYAKLRNQIQKPHAVSRMSCYLNYGVVSIFQVIDDLWQAKSTEGSKKYADEIIKWREMSYAHAFGASATYNREASVPEWSRRNLNQYRQQSFPSQYTLQQLEEGRTECEKWNAMQQYLVRTGELHNNARMPWGKTVVHWQKRHLSVEDILQELVYLNDRYALDGLSPPSYAGILWCFGWCDKPRNGSLSEKPASWYRVGPSGFKEAERILLSPEKKSQRSITDMLAPKKKQKREPQDPLTTPAAAARSKKAKSSNTLLQYFGLQKSPDSDPPEQMIG